MKKSTPKTTKPVSMSRREVAKKAAYAIPAVLTLAVTPSFASAASGAHTTPRSRRGR